MNKKFLNVVYVQGIPKVFNHLGEEINSVIDLILTGGIDTITTVKMEAPCNVWGSVEEMKFNLRIADHLDKVIDKMTNDTN